jgi:5-methylcytosine-specific restriction endonuclease McrA
MPGVRHTKRLLKKYGNICYLCGKPVPPEEMSKDHIIPKSKYKELGITKSLHGNMRIVHWECNKKKGSKFPFKFEDKLFSR